MPPTINKRMTIPPLNLDDMNSEIEEEILNVEFKEHNFLSNKDYDKDSRKGAILCSAVKVLRLRYDKICNSSIAIDYYKELSIQDLANIYQTHKSKVLPLLFDCEAAENIKFSVWFENHLSTIMCKFYALLYQIIRKEDNNEEEKKDNTILTYESVFYLVKKDLEELFNICQQE